MRPAEAGTKPGDRIVGILTPGEGITIYPIQSAALKAFEEAKHAIQLVISDVLMPGMKGLQLVRSIRNLSESTAALLMSGTRPIAADADVATIEKPFAVEAFVAKVQDLLAGCNFAKIEREQSAARVSGCRELPLNRSAPEES